MLCKFLRIYEKNRGFRLFGTKRFIGSVDVFEKCCKLVCKLFDFQADEINEGRVDIFANFAG